MTTYDNRTLDAATLAKFLDQRYGDGLIYMKSSEDRKLFLVAVSLGMVSEQGYLTGHGRQFWAQRV